GVGALHTSVRSKYDGNAERSERRWNEIARAEVERVEANVPLLGVRPSTGRGRRAWLRHGGRGLAARHREVHVQRVRLAEVCRQGHGSERVCYALADGGMRDLGMELDADRSSSRRTGANAEAHRTRP